MTRRYYSTRTGKNPNGTNIDLSMLRILIYSVYSRLNDAGFFQEHFGYYCVDQGEVPGKLGADPGAVMLFKLRKQHLWPFPEKFNEFSEEDLFDIIEFLFDHCSKPVDGHHHSYSQCGWHYHTFDKASGQTEFANRVSELLSSYKDGYELSPAGEILELAAAGTDSLLTADLPVSDANIKSRVDSAISKFRRYKSTADERRDAVRDLAGVLEYLRPQLKLVLDRQDEADLFNIANNFDIRHHNQAQKTNYDHSIWLSWIFYFYLATIHAVIRMIVRGNR
jgi:hypothetical protein